MTQSSILGGQRAPFQANGRDTDLLGPSDSSDSGSDIQGELPFATGVDDALAGTTPVERHSDSDAAGTGERAPASGTVRDAADIGPDQVRGLVDPEDAVSIDEVDVADLQLDLDDDSAEEDEDELADANDLLIKP